MTLLWKVARRHPSHLALCCGSHTSFHRRRTSRRYHEWQRHLADGAAHLRRIGLGVVAFVRVNIERHNNTDANAFIKAVSKLPEVIACYITSGESDFLLHVVVKDLAAYRSFAVEKLTRVPGVRDMRSSFVIGTVKEGALLPLSASDGL